MKKPDAMLMATFLGNMIDNIFYICIFLKLRKD